MSVDKCRHTKYYIYYLHKSIFYGKAHKVYVGWYLNTVYTEDTDEYLVSGLDKFSYPSRISAEKAVEYIKPWASESKNMMAVTLHIEEEEYIIL